MKGIDLIHDTRHLFPRSRIDGIKIVSRGISGGKQGLKFAYTSNQSQFCSLFQNKNTILVLQNVWSVRVSASSTSLLLAVKTFTIATASKKTNNDHFHS